MWTPDVYEGAPTPVVAFFATVPKLAVVCFLLRLTIEVFGSSAYYWQQVLMAMTVGSMLVGALAGLVQRNLKRLIAYSSIGHIGVVLLGVLAAHEEAVQAVLVYMMIYLSMSFGLFAVLLLLQKDGKPIETLDDVAGLSHSHPKTAAALAILMFSMAGIPPFTGFFAKLFVFTAALEAGFVGLVVLGALCSVVSCFYYIRIVKVMYFDEQTEAPSITQKHPVAGYVLLASIAVNLFIFAPDTVMITARIAAMALFP
jgi:NADH-quinone oxidoreductase subunit N